MQYGDKCGDRSASGDLSGHSGDRDRTGIKTGSADGRASEGACDGDPDDVARGKISSSDGTASHRGGDPVTSLPGTGGVCGARGTGWGRVRTVFKRTVSCISVRSGGWSRVGMYALSARERNDPERIGRKCKSI